MNESMDIPTHTTSPLQVQVSLIAKDPVRSKRPEGRVLHILTDPQALNQWQSNLEKLRLKDAPL